MLGTALFVPAALASAWLVGRLAGYPSAAAATARGLRWLVLIELSLLVVFLILGFGYEQHARARDRRLYRPPGKLVELGGYRVHLDCQGQSRPTVVLTHGHQGSYVDWYLAQPEIAAFARVCSYDRAGYGWSDPSPKPRVLSVMAEELHTALARAGENPPYILVGHSFGALEALMFAHRFPGEVAGLVLVDGAQPEMLPPMGLRRRVWLRTMELTVPLGLPRWRRWCGGSGAQALVGLKQAITCRSSVYRTIYREGSSFPESVAEFSRINTLAATPLIIIARDPTLAPDRAEEQRWNQLQRRRLTLSSRSEFVIAAGSGHDVPLARPEVVIQAVKKLVDQISGTARKPGDPAH